MKFGWCIALCLGCLAFAWLVLGGASRVFCEMAARHEYLQSRPGASNSDAFVTMGIDNRMATNEVLELLSRANWTSGLLRRQDEGNDEVVLAQFFRFVYGPLWRPFNLGTPRPVCEEMIRVTFDLSGRARTVSREYVTGILIFSEPREVHLGGEGTKPTLINGG